MSTNKESLREIQVFKKFASKCPLSIDLNSIEKRKPPEPDILCCLEDGAKIAFELVEVIDRNLAKSVFTAPNLKRAFDKYLDNLPADRKGQFDQKYGDASIYIAFEDDISAVRCRRSIPIVFDYLLNLDDQAEGKFTLSSHNALRKTVRWINIYRGGVGPDFDVKGSAWFGDPICDSIRNKFKKQYRLKFSIDLLAYYESQPELPENRWLPSVKLFLEAKLKSSVFSRVWVYSVTKDRIIYIYPEN